MEDRWQLERTNGSSEGFVFSVEGKTQEGITAGYKMGAINTCSVSSPVRGCSGRSGRGQPRPPRSPGVGFFCGDELIPASRRVYPDKAGRGFISPAIVPTIFSSLSASLPVAQVSKPVCQEISDLREGQLLALCRQPGVGAVIYLLFGAASV